MCTTLGHRWLFYTNELKNWFHCILFRASRIVSFVSLSIFNLTASQKSVGNKMILGLVWLFRALRAFKFKLNAKLGFTVFNYLLVDLNHNCDECFQILLLSSAETTTTRHQERDDQQDGGTSKDSRTRKQGMSVRTQSSETYFPHFNCILIIFKLTTSPNLDSFRAGMTVKHRLLF